MELGALRVTAAGFAAGFGALYGFDLFVHRGQLAGEHAEQHELVERFYHEERLRGGE